MATHSSFLAWEIPWTEEPRRLQPLRSQRVGHNWAHTHTRMHAFLLSTLHFNPLNPYDSLGNPLCQRLRWLEGKMTSCHLCPAGKGDMFISMFELAGLGKPKKRESWNSWDMGRAGWETSDIWGRGSSAQASITTSTVLPRDLSEKISRTLAPHPPHLA